VTEKRGVLSFAESVENALPMKKESEKTLRMGAPPPKEKLSGEEKSQRSGRMEEESE